MDCNGLIAGLHIIVDEEEEVEIDPSFYQYHYRPPRTSSHHNRYTHPDSDDDDPTRSSRRNRAMRSAPSPRLATPPTPGAPPASPVGSSHREMSERMREDVESTGGLRRTFRMTKEEFRDATRNLFPESNGQRTRNPPSRTASADTATDRKGTLDKSVKETSGSGSGSGSGSSKGRKLEERRSRTEERRGRPEERRGKTEDKEKTEERRTRTEQNKARLEDRKVKAGASRRPGQRISSSSGKYASKERNRGIH